jgi:hypothetical protein
MSLCFRTGQDLPENRCFAGSAMVRSEDGRAAGPASGGYSGAARLKLTLGSVLASTRRVPEMGRTLSLWHVFAFHMRVLGSSVS